MLKVQSISFSYANAITLNAIDFTLQKGKILAIIGESGCGKSTLLKLIYGLHDTDEGQIFWNDKKIYGPKNYLVPGMEFIKYLAQDFDLMPYITVAENVGKFLSNVDIEKKTNRIKELLDVVDLSEYFNERTANLSGGQMQRVALAKALAVEPDILLLDEPFSHIDNFKKNELRYKLFAFIKQNNITTIIATHDCTDILSFADEVMVLKKGAIIDHGATKRIYNHPKNKYVASLFGEVNEIKSTIFDDKTAVTKLLLYPHQIEVVTFSKLQVEVVQTFFRGSHFLIKCVHNNERLYVQHFADLKIGSKIFIAKKLRN